MAQTPPNKGSETLFTTDRDAAASDEINSLGDGEALLEWLRGLIADLLEEDGADKGEVLNRQADEFAKVTLGEDPNWRPVHGWNRAGGIDEHIAGQFHLQETDPKDRMRWLYADMMEDVSTVIELADRPGATTEDWDWQLADIIDTVARLLIGLPLAALEEDDE